VKDKAITLKALERAFLSVMILYPFSDFGEILLIKNKGGID
jgi:hypothetical protein